MTLRVPINLTNEQIETFRQLYKRTTGKTISKEKAEQEVLRTLAFMASVIDERYR